MNDCGFNCETCRYVCNLKILEERRNHAVVSCFSEISDDKRGVLIASTVKQWIFSKTINRTDDFLNS